MGFLEMVEADISGVFFNSNEFASCHTVIYDGERYDDIDIILVKLKESDRKISTSKDHMEGIYLVSAIASIPIGKIGGKIPEKGQDIYIDDGTALGEAFFRKYNIITSDNIEGVVKLDLEALDE